MICPKCGANTAESDSYCEDCGVFLKKVKDVESTINDYKSDIVVVDPHLAAVSNIGRKHPENEDAGTVMRCKNGAAILIVADGVSSAVNATSASQKAVDTVREILSRGSSIDINLIRTAIYEANNIILGMPYETRTDGVYGPETTIVVGAVRGNTATIGWVGDSRAYIISKTVQKLLTIDDSWIEHVVKTGEMKRSEAIKDKRAHYVTQVLGMHDQPMEIHILRHKLEQGQMLLLCSDGLWNYLQGDNELLKAIVDFGIEKDAIAICENLIGFANNSGGHDNITVAIFKNF